MKLSDRPSEYKVNADRAEFFGYFLLAGLGLELLFALFVEKSWLEWASIVGPDAMIVIGVWGEIHFGRKARIAGDAAEAEAEARIKEATLETERLRSQFAWRQLTTKQSKSLAAALREERFGGAVVIWYLGSDAESQNFVYQFATAFRNAGWTCGFQHAQFVQIVPGIRVPDPEWPFRAKDGKSPNTEAIRAALVAAGIPWGALPLPEPISHTGYGRGGHVSPNLAPLYIGPKPPPAFEDDAASANANPTTMP